ncbi:MAG: hypothetical protein WD825_12150 [Gemmatimonadaceae bacterium]
MVRRRAGATKLGCLIYLLVVSALLYFGIPAGETYFRYLEYKDSMRQELRFRSNLSNDKIRAHLKLVADSLGLPEEAGDVTVTRKGNMVTVEADYDESIQLPGFKKVVRFQPRASDTY